MTTQSRSSARKRLKLSLLAACAAAISVSAFPAASSALIPVGPPILTCVLLDVCGPSISSGPAEGSVQPSTSASFAFSRTNAFNYLCSLDGATPAACTSPQAYSGLAEGAHTFGVFAHKTAISHICLGFGGTPPCIDIPYEGAATNTTTRHFTVDHTSPVASFTSGPAEGSTIAVNNATIGFTATDATAVSFKCKIDAAAAGDCSSPLGLTNLSAGAHKLVVTPTDAAGNVGASIARNFTFTPPAAQNVTNTGTTTPTTKHCIRHKRVKVKKHGKVVHTKSGKIKYKKKCVKYSS